MTERIFGSKYNRNLSTTEIAKKIREDIKTAIKNKELPEIKTSIRTEYYSMGSSINIKIIELPFNPFNKERVIDEIKNPFDYKVVPIYSEKGQAVLDKIEEIARAHNHDGSEPQTDYFDVNFYCYVRFDYEKEEEWRNEIKKELD